MKDIIKDFILYSLLGIYLAASVCAVRLLGLVIENPLISSACVILTASALLAVLVALLKRVNH